MRQGAWPRAGSVAVCGWVLAGVHALLTGVGDAGDMPKKRKVFVHVGMPGVGDVIEAALIHHRGALVELDVAVPAKSSHEGFNAAVEMTRSHKSWGMRRKDVEGTWAKLCRRVEKGRSTVVVSQPLLATATRPQIDLLLDALTGFQVHVVITATAPHAWCVPGEPETDLGVVLDRWGGAVRKPERLHVLLVGSDPEQPEQTQRQAWKAFGKVAGFGTASLGLDDVPQPVAARPLWLVPTVPAERAGVLDTVARAWLDQIETGGYDVVGDAEAVLGRQLPIADEDARRGDLDQLLHEAVREIERLTRRTESLEAELESVDRKRRKLKKKLRDAA